MDYREMKAQRAKDKKLSPVTYKFRFIMFDIFEQISRSICNTMNRCGWKYTPVSLYEERDKWYKWTKLNFEARLNHIQDKINLNNLDIPNKIIISKLLNEAYTIFLEGHKLSYAFSRNQFLYYDSWFRKNIKKFNNIL